MLCGLHRLMAEQFGHDEEIMRRRIRHRGESVPQRVCAVSVWQQMADMVSDLGLLHVAAEPAREQVAMRVHDDAGQIIRQRHYALLVAFAAHDQ